VQSYSQLLLRMICLAKTRKELGDEENEINIVI